jgi:AraC family transcriptional regulator
VHSDNLSTAINSIEMISNIAMFPEMKLIGFSRTMSLSENTTPLLWQTFMKHQSEISNRVGNELYSLQQYKENYFNNFSPSEPFLKWACAEVSSFTNVPAGMETMLLEKGLYAVFHYKGKPSEAESFFNYIFMDWLPSSEFVLDQRPHFEILGEKYINNSSESEEKVCIPVREK